MMRFSRYILPIVLLFVVLIGCGPTSADARGASKTPSSGATARPTSTPADAVVTTCPSYLKSLPGCFTPQAFRQAYGVDKLIQQGITGKGQTIVDIVSFGSPTLQKDMQVYDKQFGLPAVDLKIISPLHEPVSDPNHDRAGWAEETTLDVQVIHAIAPDAKIVVLTSPVSETEGTIGLPEFRKLEQYVVDHKLGTIVSQSWAASEITLKDAAGQKELQKWNSFYQQTTTKKGITYFASSGDNGATDFTDLQAKHLSSTATTGFPTDSPWVVSVGGTTLSSNGSTFSEQAWSNSGGGFSRFYKTPSFQKGLSATVQSELKGRRGVPDVAGSADPSAALVNYVEGQWTLIGGTSASAPLWAGISALANQEAGHALGFINPGLYKLATSSTYARDFNDITVGNNSNDSAHVKGYSAVPGWDPITGLGSPKAQNLVPDLVAAMQ